MKRLSNKCSKNSKNNPISQNSTLTKRKGQEGLRYVRKFCKNRKSNKNFASYVKRLSNKYCKNSKNNKFHKILHLEREKRSRRALRCPQISHKSQKEQEFFFLCEKIEQQIWQKKARTTNFTKFYTWKEERSRRASVSPQTRIFHAMCKD